MPYLCALEVRGWDAAEVLPRLREALGGTGLYLPPLHALIARYLHAPRWTTAQLTSCGYHHQQAEPAVEWGHSPIWDAQEQNDMFCVLHVFWAVTGTDHRVGLRTAPPDDSPIVLHTASEGRSMTYTRWALVDDCDPHTVPAWSHDALCAGHEYPKLAQYTLCASWFAKIRRTQKALGVLGEHLRIVFLHVSYPSPCG